MHPKAMIKHVTQDPSFTDICCEFRAPFEIAAKGVRNSHQMSVKEGPIEVTTTRPTTKKLKYTIFVRDIYQMGVLPLCVSNYC